MLEEATAPILPNMQKAANMTEQKTILDTWTLRVGNALNDNNLLMYKTFFDNLHNYQRYFEHRLTEEEKVYLKWINILDAKRMELKEIIKDLNFTKNNL